MSSEVHSNWYLYTAVGRVGPLTLEQARDLASRGALRPQDLAWRPGMSDWKKVSEIEALQPPIQVASIPATVDPVALSNDANSRRFPRVSKSALVSLSSAVVLGALTYFAYPFVSAWFSDFPKIPELAQDQYKLLKDTAQTDLKTLGPKIEIASALRNDGSSTFYIATNLGDHAVFDLSFEPISDTLVGEPREIQPLHLSTKQHLALAGVETTPPGYYWVTLTSPQQPDLLIHRKVFLGGTADLNYQTHLSDYAAIRRGVAKAELDRIRGTLAKVDALMLAENKAAESLSTLRINSAKTQAWEMFQETWTRGFSEIQALLTRPSRYSGKLLREAQGVQELLKKLHDKHHELVAAVVTPASAQLSPGTITTARVFADAQAISNDISTQIKNLGHRLDERQRLFDNPLYPMTEEP